MRNRVTIFAVCLCVVLVGQAFAQTSQVRIVTWNLEWFPGRSMKPAAAAKAKQIAAAKKILADLKPDVLLAQEITDRTAFEDLLTAVPGLDLCVMSTYTARMARIQQVAVASKFPARSAWWAPWATNRMDLHRGYAFAALQTATDTVVMVYSVHLKSNRPEYGLPPDAATATNIAHREESVRQLMVHAGATRRQLAADVRVAGILVGGDLNTNTDNPEWKAERSLEWIGRTGFWNAWEGVPATNRWSWIGDGRFQPCTFDYLFLWRMGKPVARLWAGDLGGASDHRPVIVDLPLSALRGAGGAGAAEGGAGP
jgi:endonuclease/exonuclease/phosphatase family metal-dependent hydrolase